MSVFSASSTRIIEFGALTPRDFLARHFETRSKAANKLAKARLRGASHLDDLSETYAAKNKDLNMALRLGVAKVAFDETCSDTSISIRFGDRPSAHLPACLIEDDVHAMIVAEAASLAGIDLRVV